MGFGGEAAEPHIALNWMRAAQGYSHIGYGSRLAAQPPNVNRILLYNMEACRRCDGAL